MRDSITNEQFSALLISQLELFEPILAERAIPVPLRPMRATSMFFEYCVKETRNATDERMDKFFQLVLKQANAWYEERFGAALHADTYESVCGAVLVHGTAFELAIPLTLRRKDDDPEYVWVVWPKEILDDEAPEEFLVLPPVLSSEEGEAAKKRIANVVTRIRAIKNNLRSVSLETREESALAHTLLTHLSQAARALLMRENERALAVWDLQLAVEKAIKLFIRQKGEEPKHTHDLIELDRIARARGGWRVDAQLLTAMPHWKAAIGYRYGNDPALSLDELFTIYNAALRLVQSTTDSMEHFAEMNNTSVKVKPFDLS